MSLTAPWDEDPPLSARKPQSPALPRGRKEGAARSLGWFTGHRRLAGDQRPCVLDAAGLVKGPSRKVGARCGQRTFWVNHLRRSQKEGAGIATFPVTRTIIFSSNDILLLYLHFHSWTLDCTRFRLGICLAPGPLRDRGRCQGLSLSSKTLWLCLMGSDPGGDRARAIGSSAVAVGSWGPGPVCPKLHQEHPLFVWPREPGRLRTPSVVVGQQPT